MSGNDNILSKVKDFADTSLSSFGIIPPDRMSSMIKDLTKKISNLEKRVTYLENNRKKNPKKNVSRNRNDLDEFDTLGNI